MVVAYSMVAVDNYTSLLLRLTWVRTSIDLVGSRVLLVIKAQVDVEDVSMWQLGWSRFKDLEVQGESTYSEVR